jgi:anaerobic selenocysteine-containing dehydrogenase
VVASGPVHGWVHERMLPPGGWRLAPAPLMTALAEAVDSLDVDDVDVDRVADPSSGPADHRPALVLVPHRQLRTMNSQLRDIAAPGAATESVEVRVHPSVVAALGLDAGSTDGTDGTGSADGAGSPVTVTVTSAHGSVEGVLHADDRLHPEAVVVAHGWTGPNVSALTSAADGVDPLTGMPRLGGVPVEVTLAGTVGPDDPST